VGAVSGGAVGRKDCTDMEASGCTALKSKQTVRFRLIKTAFLALTVVLCAAADDGPRVDGVLINAGATVKLDHVLVVQSGNEEGLQDGPHLRIFLTDGEIPLMIAGAATTVDAVGFARQAKIYGVVILADPTGSNMNAGAYNLNLPPWVTPAPPGFAAKTPDPHIIRQLQVTATHASGEAHIDLVRGSVSASFDAPITPDPVTQDLSGDAAIDSAPAKAFLVYADALARGDMAAVSKYATTRYASRIAALYSGYSRYPGLGAAGWAKFIASDRNMAALPNSISRVIVRGNSATVVFQLKAAASLIFDEGSWKVN